MNELQLDGQVRSYAVVLPPGWGRIPVAEPEPVVAQLLDDAFDGLPRDSYGPIRREAEKALWAQLRHAREVGGLDLYLPVGGARGLPMPASFVVSHLPSQQPGYPAATAWSGALAGNDATLTTLVLADLLDRSDGDLAARDVAGAPAVRRERVVPSATGADSEPSLDAATRRVDYVVPVPGDGGWLLVSFSVAELDLRAPSPEGDPPGTGARLTDLLVELFDAVMGTLRWRTIEREAAVGER